MAISYHEPTTELSSETRDVHRALTTLVEELEAVDWYHQRADVTQDADLKMILIHNRDEEIEHAAMALEWLRRRIPEFDEQLRTFLFTTKPIAHEESDEAEGDSESEPAAPGGGADQSLNIGKL